MDDQRKHLSVVGGASLSNAVYAHGLVELKTTMEDTPRSMLEYYCAKKQTIYA
jgi:hypothetical protein